MICGQRPAAAADARLSIDLAGLSPRCHAGPGGKRPMNSVFARGICARSTLIVNNQVVRRRSPPASILGRLERGGRHEFDLSPAAAARLVLSANSSGTLPGETTSTLPGARVVERRVADVVLAERVTGLAVESYLSRAESSPDCSLGERKDVRPSFRRPALRLPPRRETGRRAKVSTTDLLRFAGEIRHLHKRLLLFRTLLVPPRRDRRDRQVLGVEASRSAHRPACRLSTATPLHVFEAAVAEDVRVAGGGSAAAIFLAARLDCCFTGFAR